MRATRRYWVWLAVSYAGIVSLIGVFVVLPGVGVDEPRRDAYFAALADAGPALVYAAGILLFVCAGALRWAFRRYPQAAHQLADQTRVLLAANPDHQVVGAGGPEIAELAAVINQLADGHRRLKRDLD